MKKRGIRLEADVVRRLQAKATEEGGAVQDLANDLLRKALDDGDQRAAYKLNFLTWKAELLPGVDICDRKTLLDIMDDR